MQAGISRLYEGWKMSEEERKEEGEKEYRISNKEFRMMKLETLDPCLRHAGTCE